MAVAAIHLTSSDRNNVLSFPLVFRGAIFLQAHERCARFDCVEMIRLSTHFQIAFSMMCLVVRGRARAGCEESFAERPWPKLLLAKEWRTLQQRLTADGKFEGKRDLKFRFSETSKVRAGLRYHARRVTAPHLSRCPLAKNFGVVLPKAGP